MTNKIKLPPIPLAYQAVYEIGKDMRDYATSAVTEALAQRDADHLAELQAYEPTVANLREQLAQQAPQVAHPDNLEQIIDDYVDDYVMEGDDGTYRPTEPEKCLLKDAVMGLLADPEWNSAWGKIVEGSKPAPQVPMTKDSVIELVMECGLDWQKGFMPLFEGDLTNRFAVLVEAIEAHHGIKEQA